MLYKNSDPYIKAMMPATAITALNTSDTKTIHHCHPLTFFAPMMRYTSVITKYSALPPNIIIPATSLELFPKKSKVAFEKKK